MKIFLLIYDRDIRKLLLTEEFTQEQRPLAMRARRDAEIAAIREGRKQEIVILEAESLDALKRTHGSYFYTIQELTEKLRDLAS
jgi:hypothetical protein